MEGLLLFFILAVIAMIFFSILEYYKKEKETKSDPSAQEENFDVYEYESVVYNAEVVSGRIFGHYDGRIRTPRYYVDFYITFLIEGKEREYLVPKEVFERAKKGQKGILIEKNNLFMSFDIEE